MDDATTLWSKNRGELTADSVEQETTRSHEGGPRNCNERPALNIACVIRR